MRSLIISIVIIITTILLVAFNGIYTNKALNELYQTISDLPDAPDKNCTDKINGVKQSWEEIRERLAFTTDDRRLQAISEDFSSLQSAQIDNNMTDYAASRDKLKIKLKHLSDTEKIRMEAII